MDEESVEYLESVRTALIKGDGPKQAIETMDRRIKCARQESERQLVETVAGAVEKIARLRSYEDKKAAYRLLSWCGDKEGFLDFEDLTRGGPTDYVRDKYREWCGSKGLDPAPSGC